MISCRCCGQHDGIHEHTDGLSATTYTHLDKCLRLEKGSLNLTGLVGRMYVHVHIRTAYAHNYKLRLLAQQ